jgi:uncharacterized glyoxalase superfamily protein PhnB
MRSTVKPVPDGYHTVTPYLTVRDAGRLLEFLEQAFGATVVQRTVAPDGTIGHSEVQIGDSRIMASSANDAWAPRPGAIYLYLENVDRFYQQALAAGARSLMEPTDTFYGDRNAGVEDPTGNHWWIATHIEDVSQEEMARRAAEVRAK